MWYRSWGQVNAVQNDCLSFPFRTFSAQLTGLEDGQYEIHYYYHGATSGMSTNGTAMNDLAGGSAEALTAQGTNWDIATGVTVTGGQMNIFDATCGSDGLSGIQLVRVP